jgi:hypothetical protein
MKVKLLYMSPATPRQPRATRVPLYGVAVGGVLGLGLLAACARTTLLDGTDGSTRWLFPCASDADCGELSCLCGACTRRCEDRDACAELGSDSECAMIDDGRCAGERPRACVAACANDAQCTAEMSGTECAGGQCWPEARDRPHGAGTGGAAGVPPPGPCAAMAATHAGTDCARTAGYAWDGRRCFDVVCGCTGADCDRLFESLGACEAAYLECRDDGDPVILPPVEPVTDCIDREVRWRLGDWTDWIGSEMHSYVLTPCRHFRYERYGGIVDLNCSHDVAMDAETNVDDVDRALADPAVLAAFATGGYFGTYPPDSPRFGIEFAGRTIGLGPAIRY